jgi:CHAD domain-containing protein
LLPMHMRCERRPRFGRMVKMQTATETERKYDVPAGFALPSLAGTAGIADVAKPDTHNLDATYYDTDDLRLARHSRTLRRRTGGSDAGWHLKTPGDGSSRTEHRLPLDSGTNPASGSESAPDNERTPGSERAQQGETVQATEAAPDSERAQPSERAPDGERTHGGEAVPEELRSEVRAIVRDRELRPVARLRTHRVETPLCAADGRTLAVIAQDDVTAETDAGEQRWQEVEVELVDGDPKLLDAVERQLLAAGATPAAGPSKLARALGDRLMAPQTEHDQQGDHDGHGEAGRQGEDDQRGEAGWQGDREGHGETGRQGEDDRHGEAGRHGKGGDEDETEKINPVLAYAREQRDAVIEQDPGVRHGDAESVHRMRVATRRLRSTLRTYRRTFGADALDRLGPELKWLAGLLGEVRDGQVLEQQLLAAVEEAGPEFAPVAVRVRQHLDAKIAAGRATLATELNAGRYLRLLDAVDELVADPAVHETHPIGRAAKALRKADELLEVAVADGEDAELHEARKAYKRARYAVEVFVPSEGKPAKKLVKALTDLQEVLGAHQDSVVAREILSELAGPAPDGFPYGVLYARQEQVGRDTFAELPAVIEAAGKSGLRDWLS